MRDAPLTYTSKIHGDKDLTVLTLTGPATLPNLFDFQKALKSPITTNILVDFSSSDYMDSAGLGALMNFYVSTARHDRKLLLAGLNFRLQAMLESTRVHTLLSIFPTVDAAASSLQPPPPKS